MSLVILSCCRVVVSCYVLFVLLRVVFSVFGGDVFVVMCLLAYQQGLLWFACVVCHVVCSVLFYFSTSSSYLCLVVFSSTCFNCNYRVFAIASSNHQKTKNLSNKRG